MTKKELLDCVGGLSKPSKMPCYGYSTPAQSCLTGSKLAEVANSVCFGCYALKGNYNYPVVKNALAKRLALIDTPEWAGNMATAINAVEKSGYFRWHDSGDLQSVEHLEKIVSVTKMTPTIKHWLPTREYKIVADYRAMNGEFPSNLTVRLSAHMIDGTAPDVGLPTSTVTSSHEGATCAAPSQGGKCLDCRACWNPKVGNVAYAKH